MGVQVECDGDDCSNDILGSTGFQLMEGEVIVDCGSEAVEQEEYHGVFCSQDCLISYLKDREIVEMAAVSKLEDIVEEEGVPDRWKPILQEVRDELVEESVVSEDFPIRKIYEYTEERRDELYRDEVCENCGAGLETYEVQKNGEKVAEEKACPNNWREGEKFDDCPEVVE